MSLFGKTKTAIKILKTRGLKGILQTIYTKFDRSFRPDETEMVYDLLKTSAKPGLMIDVGAHHGSSLAPFADNGWQVIAFEPDTKNRRILTDTFGNYENVIIDPRACSDQAQQEATLYASAESSGVSGLSAFLDSHEASEKVSVTTLAAALAEYDLTNQPVDFLKIDTEGFDQMVLMGYPWESGLPPSIILCEFEDAKTKPLGYDFFDLAEYLVKHTYRLIISEWYPVKVYGGTHRWRRFNTYPCQLADPNAWGNIFAIKNIEHFEKLTVRCKLE